MAFPRSSLDAHPHTVTWVPSEAIYHTTSVNDVAARREAVDAWLSADERLLLAMTKDAKKGGVAAGVWLRNTIARQSALAHKGNAEALFALALINLEQDGPLFLSAWALSCFQLAADRGLERAKLYLGFIFHERSTLRGQYHPFHSSIHLGQIAQGWLGNNTSAGLNSWMAQQPHLQPRPRL